MTNLTRFDQDGIELVINTVTGAAYASQAGYARMSGVNYSTVKKRVERLKGGDSLTLETAEIQTIGGLQEVTLLPADLVYDWMFEDNPALAKAMGKAGATVYMHQLAGFSVTSTATVLAPAPQPQPINVEITPAKLDLLRSAMSSVTTPLVDGFILNRIQYHHLELKADIEAAHSLLAATNSIPEVLLTPTAIGERPKYLIKIKLLKSLPCLVLSTVSALRFFAHSNNHKELLVDIAIDEVFGRFMSLLLTEVSDGNSITLSGKMDKAVFIAKNIFTKDAQHFLEIFCDGQPQTIQLHPVGDVTFERVSFENY